MGKLSNAVLDYFDDNVRFANLFNGSLFGGRNVVNPQELVEGSEVYPDDEPRVEELTNEENQGQVIVSVPWQGEVDRTQMPKGYDEFRRSRRRMGAIIF